MTLQVAHEVPEPISRSRFNRSPHPKIVSRPERHVATVHLRPESMLALDEDAGMAVVMNVMRGLGR